MAAGTGDEFACELSIQTATLRAADAGFDEAHLVGSQWSDYKRISDLELAELTLNPVDVQ